MQKVFKILQRKKIYTVKYFITKHIFKKNLQQTMYSVGNGLSGKSSIDKSLSTSDKSGSNKMSRISLDGKSLDMM